MIPRKTCFITNCTTFIFFFLFILNDLKGQELGLPEIVRPSLESEALTRYGNYPMANYNGLTDITIPLHQVAGRKLSLPISISFHASGRMANETNDILGMRWTLNCGGLVTRTMKGAPDEWNTLLPFSLDFYNNEVPSFDLLYKACPNGKYDNAASVDSEYDIFNYSLPNGKTGHFILKNTSGGKVPMLIPYEPLKVEWTKATDSKGFIDAVTIIDTDGIKYIFGKTGSATANAVELTMESDAFNGQLVQVPTAWYLSKIVSNDNQEEIIFNYNSRQVNTYNNTQFTTVYDRSRDDNSSFYLYYTPGPGSNPSDPYIDYLASFLINYHFQQEDIYNLFDNRRLPVLSSIQFLGGSASFSYRTETTGNNSSFLNNITIFNGSTISKRIEFQTTKHPNENDIYYLDGMTFQGENLTEKQEHYAFTYYEDSYVDVISQNHKKKDWWGYFCRYPGSQLMPLRNIPIVLIGGSGGTIYRDVGYVGISRDPIKSDKEMGMLKTISYPTAGQTEFIYEENKYANDSYQPGQSGNLLSGPGLRIKEVISKPSVGHNIHKVYKYGTYEDGRGFINEYLKPRSSSRDELTVSEGNAMHWWSPALNLQGPPLQTGYRTREYFADPYISFDLPGSPIKYDAVTEYYIDDEESAQHKTQMTYSWEDHENLIPFVVNDFGEVLLHPRMYTDPQNAWKTPLLRTKSYYTYANGIFTLTKRETLDYFLNLADEAWDMPTYLHTVINWAVVSTGGSTSWTAYLNKARDYHNGFCSVYGYGFRRYSTGSQNLTTITTEEFNATSVFKSVQHFGYNSYNLRKSESIMNSNGDQVEKNISYAVDYPSNSVLQQMVQKNMITAVVNTKETTNGIQTKNVLVTYHSPFASQYVPRTIEITQKAGSTPLLIDYSKYDKNGNILEVKQGDKPKEVYLWGYMGRYPVAKMQGTDLATVLAIPTLDTVQLNNGNDTQRENQLNKIRNYFSSNHHVMVETYTYKPFVGMTSMTDARGLKETYEYDGFARLKNVVDFEGKVLKSFQYNYIH